MESSINSPMSKLPDSYSASARERTSDHSFDEESGWTTYFDDFFAGNNNNNIKNSSFCCDDHESSSLVSDAASLVVKKSSDNGEDVVGLPIQKSYKKLSFKKRRTKGALADDALEDTASSPVNSPKVSDLMSQFNKNTKQTDRMNVPQEKGSASRHLVEEERRDSGFIDVGENDSTELKKRGLCLVPLSMVANYLG